MTPNVDQIQGDLFSRGFPKFNESYYFFTITDSKVFSEALPKLLTDNHISSLRKVLDECKKLDKHAAEIKANNQPKSILPSENALIAFTMNGLTKISQNEPNSDDIDTKHINAACEIFAHGMATYQQLLNDPVRDKWDHPFNNSEFIDGLLKVAGSDQGRVNTKLDQIKKILGTSITDVPVKSSTTGTASVKLESRLDGKVRPEPYNGHEHFGFQDGISQPLMEDIDAKVAIDRSPALKTPMRVIIVDTPDSDGSSRPAWMTNGSFLVFRKLEQDVKAFNDYTTAKWHATGSKSPDHLAAKLMGRWKSGAPLVGNVQDPHPDLNTKEYKDYVPSNAFDFSSASACPFSAHIRKSNSRDAGSGGHGNSTSSRIVRAGIPYGEEYKEHPNEKRGLLFACYQSNIGKGFQMLQKDWMNSLEFPKYEGVPVTGMDPIVGQLKDGQARQFKFLDEEGKPISGETGSVPQFVTMKGGEYFFVPPIEALNWPLGNHPGPKA